MVIEKRDFPLWGAKFIFKKRKKCSCVMKLTKLGLIPSLGKRTEKRATFVQPSCLKLCLKELKPTALAQTKF